MTDPALPFPPKPLAAPRPTLKQVGGRFVFWSPVWVPMMVLTQVALLGLRPALAEQRRLNAADEELTARIESERTQRVELERALRAQNDPIYLERERRLLQAESGPLSIK